MQAASASPASDWVRVAQADAVTGDGPFAVSAGKTDLVLLRSNGQLRAYEGICPHQGALLGEGELDGDALVCRNHRWRFDRSTGQRDGGPQCLRACPVMIRDGAVWVDPTAIAGPTVRPVPTRQVGDLPGPRGLPLLGNALALDRRRLHLILERWAAEHGPIYRIHLGPKPVVVIGDGALVADVLRARPETYRRADTVEPVFREMGVHGVFSAEGAEWRPQRKLAMEALSQRHLRSFYHTLATVAGRLVHRWERAAAANEEVEIAEDFLRFTVDVTTNLVFGYDINTLEQGDDVIQRRLELIFPALARRVFAVFPLWRYLRLPADRQLERALAELHGWIRERIADARARVAADPQRAERPADFLEAMIAARDAHGQPFSDDMLAGNALTMLLGGEDTTANTMTWAVHHLCDTPAAVAALRREVDAALGGETLPTDPEQVGRLPYAGAIAAETMRLRPVAPILFLAANVDTVLGDVALPAGAALILLMRLPCLDDRNFTAASVFRPERWLGETTGAHKPPASMPFGSGPRLCPGRSLALIEMRVLLAALYGRFDVTRAGGAVEERFAFAMQPDGVRVRLSRRSPARSRTPALAVT